MKSTLSPAPKKSAPSLEESTQPDWISKNQFSLLGGILFLTFVLYANSLKNGFTNWDDTKYITENSLIRDLSWSGIKNIFFSFYAGNYHPLVTLTNGIEFAFFKLKPTPYHVINLLLHLANTLLVFLFVSKLTRKVAFALGTALVFAIHPMHVESVAWVSERKDVLHAFFFLSALFCYLNYLQNDRKPSYLLQCLALFVCSLLSKSAAVVLPLVLLSVDYFQERKTDLRMWVEKIPFIGLSLFFGCIAFISQANAINVTTADKTATFQWFEHLFLASYAFLFYIGKFFFPFHLTALHLFPGKENGMLPYEYYAAPLGVALLVGLLFKARFMKKELLFGSLFYFFTVLLVLQLVTVGQAIVSERYSYLPYIGLSFVAWGIYAHFERQDTPPFPNWKLYLGCLAFAYTVYFCFATAERTKVWKNSITLFTDMIEKDPTTKVAYLNRGEAFLQEKEYKNAFLDFSQAIALDSTYAQAYYNHGLVTSILGDQAMALDDYARAIELKPDYLEAYYNLGNVLAGMNNTEAALQCYQKVIDIMPSNTDALFNSAALKMMRGDLSGSLPYFDAAIQYKPNYVKAFKNRGMAKLGLKDSVGACADFYRAFQLGDPEASSLLNSNCR